MLLEAFREKEPWLKVLSVKKAWTASELCVKTLPYFCVKESMSETQGGTVQMHPWPTAKGIFILEDLK